MSSRITMFAAPGVKDFAEAVDAERQRQLVKWGDQRHPDGTGGPVMRQMADQARAHCDHQAAAVIAAWRYDLTRRMGRAV